MSSQGFFFVCIPGVSSSSYKDTNPIRLGPPFYKLINLNCHIKGPISKHSHIRVKASTDKLEGHNSVHDNPDYLRGFLVRKRATKSYWVGRQQSLLQYNRYVKTVRDGKVPVRYLVHTSHFI